MSPWSVHICIGNYDIGDDVRGFLPHQFKSELDQPEPTRFIYIDISKNEEVRIWSTLGSSSLTMNSSVRTLAKFLDILSEYFPEPYYDPSELSLEPRTTTLSFEELLERSNAYQEYLLTQQAEDDRLALIKSFETLADTIESHMRASEVDDFDLGNSYWGRILNAVRLGGTIQIDEWVNVPRG